MTLEEAVEVLLRVIGCDEAIPKNCYYVRCSECPYNWTESDEISAIKVVLSHISMEEVIGNENT